MVFKLKFEIFEIKKKLKFKKTYITWLNT